MAVIFNTGAGEASATYPSTSPIGPDESFDHALGMGRKQQIHGLPAHDFQRRSSESPGNFHFVDAIRGFCRSRKAHHRRRTDDRRHRHRPLLLRIFRVVHCAVLRFAGERQTDGFVIVNLHAVNAHVLDTGFGVLGDDARCAQISAAITARGPNGSGKFAGIHVSAGMHHIKDGSICNFHRLLGLLERLGPSFQKISGAYSQRCGIEFRRGKQVHCYGA
jgi:hypothetical protein